MRYLQLNWKYCLIEKTEKYQFNTMSRNFVLSNRVVQVVDDWREDGR